MNCEFCGRFFEKAFSCYAHKGHCDPKGKRKTDPTPKVAWNRGLTKETSPIVAQGAATYQTRLKSGEVIHWQTGKTCENDTATAERGKRRSESILRKVEDGTWHNSFSRARTREYNGKKFYGSWEVAFAMHLDGNGILWDQVTQCFPYTLEGRKRNYTPDFYLPEEKVYVEVKGWPVEKDFMKWQDFPHVLRVVFGRHLHGLGLIDSYKGVDESKMISLGFIDTPNGWIRFSPS